MGSSGHIASMANSLKMNRNARRSKRVPKKEAELLYNNDQLEFKKVSKEELDIFKQKVKEKTDRYNRIRKKVLFWLIVGFSIPCLYILMFV